MNRTSLAAAFGGLMLVSVLSPDRANAQDWAPGSELIGHSVAVETRGVINTVYFDPGGAARIASDTGREYPGRWVVEAQQLCLEIGTGARECWAYQAPLQAGQAMAMTSTCGPSTWTAVSTAAPPLPPPPPPPPVAQPQGERG